VCSQCAGAAIESILKTWIGVGGSPQSVVRAARYGLTLTLAIIGGNPSRFRPFVDLYGQTLEKAGRPTRPVAVDSPGHVAATDEQARNEPWPHYEARINRIGGERGWPPATRVQFDREAGPAGSLYVGSPETVASTITHTARRLGLSRFNLTSSTARCARRADEPHRADWHCGRSARARDDETVAGGCPRPGALTRQATNAADGDVVENAGTPQ
jgi:alkanesulfonate monooxygenase SsuD/methylene tetrahydromethanopterin reductase-like flavin-dependent oxidoreductase (luciferase family)